MTEFLFEGDLKHHKTNLHYLTIGYALYSGKIPPESSLIFDIEIMEIRNGPRSHESFQEMDLNDDWKLSRSEVCSQLCVKKQLFHQAWVYSHLFQGVIFVIPFYFRSKNTCAKSLKDMDTPPMTPIMKWWLRTSSKKKMKTMMDIYHPGSSLINMTNYKYTLLQNHSNVYLQKISIFTFKEACQYHFT